MGHKQKNDCAELLKISKLIIWDEAPMAQKYCFEALDKTLKDIMTGSKSSNIIFGRKVVAFDGLIPDKEYLSSATVDNYDVNGNEAFDILTKKFHNTLITSGLPNHIIKLKIGTLIMLLRNIDQSEGLCNGTRLIVTRLANHVIEAKIISGKNVRALIYIPRMDISPT
ncbi:uncharacterized protein LOC127137763 [Lathyrus oleraceus]|uniref:uncharacterized protein LOC127137763 n=1 Tax=Pisum sativum TaxID=3888 RepID=UPI0021CE9FD5|nr:uncharacterized protein LOC127137763 [Pisum sativum]